MKPIYEKLVKSPGEGFVLKTIRGASCTCPWHFHSEYELILVLQGQGYRIVGDKVAPLQAGDVVLLGSNLPHIWQNDESGPGGAVRAHCILIQFEPSLLDNNLLKLPALTSVRRLLDRASLGVQVRGRARRRVQEQMQRMVKLRGVQRIIALLDILDTMARSRESRTIASPGFVATPDIYDEQRVNRIYRFVHEHLEEPLKLRDVARLAHLSEGAFSRFFRSHLGKTFPAFVNELRIGRACRLLAESELGVSEIALACGYRNLSNFNRQFRKLQQTTPRTFRERMQRGN